MCLELSCQTVHPSSVISDAMTPYDKSLVAPQFPSQVTLHYTALHYTVLHYTTLFCQQCKPDAVNLVQESQEECAKLRSQISKQDSHAGKVKQALADLQEAKRQADQVHFIIVC